MKKIYTILLASILLFSTKILTAQCQAYFYYNTNNNELINYSYNADSNFVGVVNYYWTFTNATPAYSTDENPTNIVFTDSTSHVCLTMTTSDSCTSTYCDDIVTAVIPTCNFEISNYSIINSSGTNNGSIDITTTGGTQPILFYWYYNGNFISNMQNLQNIYAGYYTLYAIDADSCSIQQSFTVIDLAPDCEASFYAFADTTNYGNYYFSNNSTYTADSINTTVWSWSFSGGYPATSSLEYPGSIYFQQSGYHLVCLTLTNGNCVSYYCDTIYIQPNMPCLSASGNVIQISTIGGNDGAIDLTLNNATPPVYFYWSNGAQTEDINGLSSGVYSVYIYDANTDTLNGCWPINLAFTIYEPYDSAGGPIVDTLFTNPVDTCLTFVIDSFFVNSIVVNNNTVIVSWGFTDGTTTSYITSEYNFETWGSQMIYLTLNCTNSKLLTTYSTYIRIQSVLENNTKLITDDEIKIFPNPAKDFLNINTGLKKSAEIIINIYNQTGALVSQTFEPNNSLIYLPINNLSNGIYLMEITGKDYKRVTKKFVVQK